MDWLWTEDAVTILVVVLAGIVGRFLLVRLIRATTRRALERARKRRDSDHPAEKLLAAATFARHERFEQRTATIGSLLISLTTATIATIVVLTVMSILGVPLAPLLASASIGGVALAFGAQSLVKDFLSGVFMILEDQYGVGDLIDTGEVIGTVEDVGLRVTRIRDGSGQVWYVRNGEVIRIGNLSQGWSTAVVDVPVAPDTDPAKAIAVLEKVAADFAADPPPAGVLLDAPTVVGVDQVTASAIVIRITAKTAPNQHWGVQRSLLERSVQALAKAGISGALVPPATEAP